MTRRAGPVVEEGCVAIGCDTRFPGGSLLDEEQPDERLRVHDVAADPSSRSTQRGSPGGWVFSHDHRDKTLFDLATCSGGALMRFPPNKKAAISTRGDELRKARAAAPILRIACPEAVFVRVELEFQVDPLLVHAPQTLSIYPPAKAHFAYACPFGDCSGVYDLNEVAFGSLSAGKRKTRGVLTCNGHRARNGKAHNQCELALSYSITVDTETNRRRIDRAW